MWPTWEQSLLIFAAALLEGAIGFDFGLVAAPALGALIGVRGAVVLLCLPNLMIMGLRTLGQQIPAEPLRRLMPFIGAGAAGTAVGVVVLVSSPPVILKWGVGLIVLTFALYSISKLRVQLDLREEGFFAYVAGFISGCLNGYSFAGGPLIVIYLDSLKLSRVRLARMMHVSSLTFAAVQVAVLSGAGELLPRVTSRSAVAIVPAVAGFLLGRLLRGHFSPVAGYSTGLGLMIAAAISLIVFGPGGWQ